jgi:lysyl-tRNA synthetase class 2
MEESEVLRQRKEKIRDLRARGIELFPNDFRVESISADIIAQYGDRSAEALAGIEAMVSCAGRIMAIRHFGRAAFVHLQDRKGRIQVYLRQDVLGEDAFELFKQFDLGDFVGVHGPSRPHPSSCWPNPFAPCRRNGMA